LGGIFSLLKEWTYFNETYYTYLLPGTHDIDDILKVIGSKIKVTDIFSDRHIPINGLLSKTIKFIAAE